MTPMAQAKERMSGMFQVTVNSGNKSVCVQAQAGERLMEAIERAGVTLSAALLAAGAFVESAGCAFRARPGKSIRPMRKFLSEEQIASGHRLACAAHVMSDLTVWAQVVGDQAEILSAGGQGELKRIHPSVRLIPVQVEAATLQNQQSDARAALKGAEPARSPFEPAGAGQPARINCAEKRPWARWCSRIERCWICAA